MVVSEDVLTYPATNCFQEGDCATSDELTERSRRLIDDGSIFTASMQTVCLSNGRFGVDFSPSAHHVIDSVQW